MQVETIPSGCLSLIWRLCAGVPRGLVEIFGPEALEKQRSPCILWLKHKWEMSQHLLMLNTPSIQIRT